MSYNLASIRPRSEPPFLSLNSTTGTLSLLRLLPPDWAGRQMEAVVAAVDGGSLVSSATVTIHLVARGGPRFSAALYSATVSEHAPVGEAVTTVEAIVPDPEPNLIYRIVSLVAYNLTTTADQLNLGSQVASSVKLSVALEDSPFLLEFNTGRRVCVCVCWALLHL